MKRLGGKSKKLVYLTLFSRTTDAGIQLWLKKSVVILTSMVCLTWAHMLQC